MSEPTAIATAEESVALTTIPSIWALFVSFVGLGLTAFGGVAMIVYVKDLVVRRKKWLDDETFNDAAVLCQSLPGALVMMLVAYVGLKARGIAGAFASYIAFVLPSFSFMLLLSVVYSKSHDLPQVFSLLSGLQIVVVAIVANATIRWGKDVMRTYKGAVISVVAAVLLLLGLGPVTVILVAAIAGASLFTNLQPPAYAHAAAEEHSGLLKKVAVLVSLVFAELVALYFFKHNFFQLAITMMKINIFGFGGSVSVVPLMLHEIVGVRHWVDSKTMMDALALSQVTPGPMSTASTFIGYLVSGLPGAVLATSAMYTPSFLLLLTVTPYFDRLKNSALFCRATKGAASSFAGLLLFVTYKFAAEIHWDLKRSTLCLAAAVALHKNIHVVWVVLIGAAVSVLTL